MNAYTHLASLAAGALLGLAFFTGLRLTLDGLTSSAHPAARVLGSLALRFALALGGFYLVARHGEWTHVIAAVAGFTGTRLVLVRRALASHTTPGSVS